MKFTIDETEFETDHSIMLSDQYELDSHNIVFKVVKDGQEMYVNWNGFVCQMSMERIRLNGELLRSLGWKAGDVVDMIKVDAVDAEWITVIPKTLHDWSIIQLQAEYLEEQILSQITIVSKGMEIPLRTKDGGVVRVIVDSALPDVGGALKLTRGVEIRIVPLKKVDVFRRELRVIPKSCKLQDHVGWSKIYMSNVDCVLKGQIVKINVIPFLQKKISPGMYAIVDVSQDVSLGQVMFSNGFDFMELDYEIVRYVGFLLKE